MTRRFDKKTILQALGMMMVLVILTLPAVQPFLLGEMPRTDDGNLHLYRSVALAHSWQADGAFYPRYSSGLVYGYGAALFNYFPPLSYVLPALLGMVTGDFVVGWLVSMVLMVWGTAVGAYLLGSHFAGRVGGIVTAVAYVYAPYLLFDMITRGTSSEVAALALLPWVMWAFSRVATDGGRWNVGMAVLLYALFIPLHNIMTLHGSLLLMAFCAYLWLTADEPWRVFWQMLLAGIFAVTLTTFFWLPALTETSYTRIVGVTANLDFLDVSQSLRSLGEVLAFPRRADPTQLQPLTPIALGWVQIGITLLGGVVGVWRGQYGRQTRLLMFLLLLTGGFVLLQLPISAPVWKLPLLSFTQFAWRTMGLPSLTLALATGIGAWLLLREIRAGGLKTGLFGALLLAMIVYGIPWLYTPYTDIQATDILDAQDYERRTGELTLSSFSEYLPAWTNGELDADRLREAFAQMPLLVPRLRENPLVAVMGSEWHGTRATIQFDADEATQLVFDWLYVPGWKARFTGGLSEALPLTVEPTENTGLVSVEVPAGRHELLIELNDTPRQQLAEWVSIAAGVILIIGLILWRPASDTSVSHDRNRRVFERDFMPLVVAVLVGGLAFGIKAGVIDRTTNPLRYERFSQSPPIGVDMPRDDRFAGLITLSGANTLDAVVSGGNAQISLFWRLSADAIDTDYSSLVILRDGRGNEIARAQSFQPGNLATSNWLSGYYVEDQLTVSIPAYTPPTNYTLEAALFDAATGERLEVLNTVGNPVGQSVTIGTLTVTRPATQPPPDTPPLMTEPAASGLQLWAVSDLPEQVQIGDEITFDWLWQMTDAISDSANGNITARLVWLRDDTIASGTEPLSPVADYPTSQWQRGDIWRGQQRVYVPTDLAGEYTIGVQLIQSDDVIVLTQSMRVTVPDEQVFSPPELAQSADASWQNHIALVGYEQDENRLRFAWQASAPVEESVQLFVHLLDDDDRIIAQRVGVPQNGTRPTTSWQPDEYILTEHDFSSAPAGNYRLRIGWFDPRSGTRIPLNDERDSLLLDVRIRIE